jgi:hypothetical protein
MRRIAKAKLAMAGVLFLTLGISTTGQAEPVLINGSFETGDYSGWVLSEENRLGPEDGTWGIAVNGQTISPADFVNDFHDNMYIQQFSMGLPRTYLVGEGTSMAIQLQNGGQSHRMYQDVALPENAHALSWTMFYNNMASLFGADQYLAVHIRDLNDNILETLFVTDHASPFSIDMSSFAFDISDHAGTTVRIDVDMSVYQHFFDVGFDNFQIELADSDDQSNDSPVSELAPPGWSKGKGKNLDWFEQKGKKEPKGFLQGQKRGWNKAYQR